MVGRVPVIAPPAGVALDAQLTRRDVLKLGALAAAFASAPFLQHVAGDDAAPFLRRSTFEPLVGAPFTLVTTAGKRIPVRLEAIEDTAAARRGAPRERSFSLAFRGAVQDDVTQGIYRVHHRELRPFELFVVPVGRGVHGQTYQAVVNRTHG